MSALSLSLSLSLATLLRISAQCSLHNAFLIKEEEDYYYYYYQSDATVCACAICEGDHERGYRHGTNLLDAMTIAVF